ncbi:hypothetical protein GCM10009792_18430 [Microcella alkalica]|uniref:Uncharacterized protein n=1 Tax=Microcella alkalica TaxID=355930 RepID=A0A839EHG4_9MICO|nr:hypothetical protein [Microcella alkalica]MBA8848735.1 hypothetical protein [Microcella alkalica]
MEKRAVEDVPSSQLRLVDNALRVVALDWKVDTTDVDEHLDANVSTGAPASRLQAFEVH